MTQIRCTKCEYVGPLSEFPQGNDFLQRPYVRGCPKCDNHESPGAASMSMFKGAYPVRFEVVDAQTGFIESLEASDVEV